MAVIRTPLPHSSFTMVRNCWLRDRRVSLKAKGLLTYLLSHQDGYRCSQAQMVRESDDGRDAVRTALVELERAGYLVRTPQRSSGGQFSEADYALADPFDSAGQLIPEGERDSALFPAEDARETRRVGLSGAADPTRQTRPIEEHQENTPTPTGLGTSLRAVTSSEVIEPAQAIASEHYEATGKLGGSRAFLACRGIVAGALSAGHPAPQVRAALASLRQRGRPVTNSTLGPLLADPRLTASSNTSGNGHQPYRDPDPAVYAGPF